MILQVFMQYVTCPGKCSFPRVYHGPLSIPLVFPTQTKTYSAYELGDALTKVYRGYEYSNTASNLH